MSQDIDGSYFYYDPISTDCISGGTIMISYWTTLEYDQCNVVFFMEFVDIASKVCNIWRRYELL
jgi:hypothetical protein